MYLLHELKVPDKRVYNRDKLKVPDKLVYERDKTSKKRKGEGGKPVTKGVAGFANLSTYKEKYRSL